MDSCGYKLCPGTCNAVSHCEGNADDYHCENETCTPVCNTQACYDCVGGDCKYRCTNGTLCINGQCSVP
jgi:hypothetical protein